jgi:hypothetical protein
MRAPGRESGIGAEVAETLELDLLPDRGVGERQLDEGAAWDCL